MKIQTLNERILAIINSNEHWDYDELNEYSLADKLEKLFLSEISKAFDAGYDYRSALLPEIISEFGENSMPNKDQYFNQLNNIE